MRDDTGYLDPIEVYERKIVGPTGQVDPEIREYSEITAKFNAQHGYNLGPAAAHGGILNQNGHSRFRIEHGLSEMPNEILLARLNQNSHFQQVGGDPLVKHGTEDLVPDNPAAGGYNRCRFRDTSSHAMLCLNPMGSDRLYSYFTVGYPIGMWSDIVTLDAFGNSAKVIVPEYVGHIRSATAQAWHGEPAGLIQNFLAIRIGGAGVPIFAGNPNVQYGPPQQTNRGVDISYNVGTVADAGKPILVNVFYGIDDAQDIVVKVLSRLLEKPVKSRIVGGKSTEAHAAP